MIDGREVVALVEFSVAVHSRAGLVAQLRKLTAHIFLQAVGNLDLLVSQNAGNGRNIPRISSLSMTCRFRRTEIFLNTSCLIGCLYLRRKSPFGYLLWSLCMSSSKACPSVNRIFWGGASAFLVTRRQTCGRSPSETGSGKTAWRRQNAGAEKAAGTLSG